MKKLLGYILLKDPLLILLSLLAELFGGESDGQVIRVENIVGATFIGGISFICWDLLLLSLLYYFFIRKLRLPINQLFLAGVLLHVPILMITFMAFPLTNVMTVLIAVIGSTSAAGLIYKMLTVSKYKLI